MSSLNLLKNIQLYYFTVLALFRDYFPILSRLILTKSLVLKVKSGFICSIVHNSAIRSDNLVRKLIAFNKLEIRTVDGNRIRRTYNHTILNTENSKCTEVNQNFSNLSDANLNSGGLLVHIIYFELL